MIATLPPPSSRRQSNNRRQFLKFLAASPLLASLPAHAWQNHTLDEVLDNPKDALDLMDFEAAARKALPAAHWGYLASGVDDNITRDANHEAYRRIQLRPRKLIDVNKIDTRVELFGITWDSPIFLSPIGAQEMFHSDGEMAVARAAQARKTLQILSTVTSHSVEDVIKARGGPVWYQLYAVSDWGLTEKVAKRAEDAGCPVLAWTIDLLAGRNTETASRFRRIDSRGCATCHGEPFGAINHRPMFDGLEMKGVTINSPAFSWTYVDRLKKATRMKLVLKGIETREDARLCVEHGVDGILVSNHGGRATETYRGTIECLPEVVDAVAGRIPVMVDGGIRRGTDAYKALAFGARAVGIGRPYVWGLSAFGQAGVEKVIEILNTEFALTMRQCGARSLAEISRSTVMYRESNS
ncbi:MAG: alpha-hydroxy-acid oxidizing protein [Bryobacterales bacterium]|nr:alpha-hydroxy-acid oxidizing protein [Bryobacterales bacterium]